MNSERTQIELLPIATLVLWSVCVVVGLVGHFVTERSAPTPTLEKPTETTMVNVSLTDSPVVPAADAAAITPSAAENLPLPQAAVISAPVEFAIPKQRPTPMAAVAQEKPAQDVPSFKQITFGTGEGNQPRPEYPIEAELDGQEGTVEVQFVVGLDGRVTSTQVTRPCSWPLLNQAAERSIHESWTYPAGPVRYLRVSITYRQKH